MFTVTIQADQISAKDESGELYKINCLVIKKDHGNTATYTAKDKFYLAVLAPNTTAKALLIKPGLINVY